MKLKILPNHYENGVKKSNRTPANRFPDTTESMHQPLDNPYSEHTDPNYEPSRNEVEMRTHHKTRTAAYDVMRKRPKHRNITETKHSRATEIAYWT
jgi:hypothetical protein